MARSFLAISFLTLTCLTNLTAAVTVPHWALVGRKEVDKAWGGDSKWKGHDEIVSLPQKADSELQMRYSPYLFSKDGCAPYPAVDAEGYHGAGLQPSGDAGGDCRDFKQLGQMYARTGLSTINRRTGIMYAVYVPKIQQGGEKHRHHWMAAVVWLSKESCDDSRPDQYLATGISYLTSQNGFDSSMTPTPLWTADPDSGPGVPTHPIVVYDGNQVFGSATERYNGRVMVPPLVGWESGMTNATRDQLNNIEYLDGRRVPFSDVKFQAMLDAAYRDTMWTENLQDKKCGDDGDDGPKDEPKDEPNPDNSTDPNRETEPGTINPDVDPKSHTGLEDGDAFEEEPGQERQPDPSGNIPTENSKKNKGVDPNGT